MDAGSAAPLKICKGIINSMKFPAENIQIGKTKVLYRAAEYRKLEVSDELIDPAPNVLWTSFLGLRIPAAFIACLNTVGLVNQDETQDHQRQPRDNVQG